MTTKKEWKKLIYPRSSDKLPVRKLGATANVIALGTQNPDAVCAKYYRGKDCACLQRLKDSKDYQSDWLTFFSSDLTSSVVSNFVDSLNKILA